MPWKSTAISVGGSLLGGVFGGGNKKAERAAKDAAARAQYAQEEARAQAQAQLAPFVSNGTNASNELAYLLGTGGYDKSRPTYDQAYEELRGEHFKNYGKDYNRNSNVPGQRLEATKRYEERLGEWQKGFDEWKAKQGGDDSRFGSLNRNFTNADFVKDPGYMARLLEGEQGVNRAQLARGGFDSGAALKEINRFNQDYASNEFGNAYNRDSANKTRTYNNLFGLSEQGRAAIGTGIGVNTNAASNIGNSQQNLAGTLLQSGQNQADNQSNAFQSALGNLIYGMNRNNGRVDNYVPSNGGSSSLRARDMFL